MGKTSTAEVLRLRAQASCPSHKSVRRSAQDDSFVGILKTDPSEDRNSAGKVSFHHGSLPFDWHLSLSRFSCRDYIRLSLRSAASRRAHPGHRGAWQGPGSPGWTMAVPHWRQPRLGRSSVRRSGLGAAHRRQALEPARPPHAHRLRLVSPHPLDHARHGSTTGLPPSHSCPRGRVPDLLEWRGGGPPGPHAAAIAGDHRRPRTDS
jgi:hypothetical protein